MKSPIVRMAAVLFAAALGLALTACEDSDLTAPVDGQIILTANPATVVLDPDQGITSGESTITATVFDADGRAVQNVSVLFSVSGGGGSLDPVSAKTDPSGKAQTVLTLTMNDPSGSQVTAQSSSLSESVQIEKIDLEPNQQPAAGIVASPDGLQLAGRIVLFDGQFSSDPDGDEITCWQWSINSTLDSSDEIVQGAVTSSIERTYADEQFLTVTLRVSDDPSLTAECQPGLPPVDQNRLSPNFAKIDQYEISCSNEAPVAEAGPDLRGLVGSFIVLDGSQSTDDRGSGQLHYEWTSCGGGIGSPIPVPNRPEKAQCQYNVAGDYTAVLKVTDEGTGQRDPMGNFICEKEDFDTTTVTVVVP